jgi:hypothetical protein
MPNLLFVTKRLLDNTKKSKHICADASYKLLQYGFPVLVAFVTSGFRDGGKIGLKNLILISLK